MDPDEALARIIDAAIAGDGVALQVAADNLADWLKRDGFAPKDPRARDAAAATG